ncbi:MAG: TIGR04013 family B12-binding domain/radical SAM domain-containing protein [Candidatus Heimdallarchaeota archaeon]|nr:TIGR04013 family B12-binding domain/radical SAM domain-containing protein [Candidatus Heimdallarchaeota archaeon]MCK4768995.1 TIGR04013 family B12-binding domain/radical SAM domain-containing protein [Candidatus Heimdallarchaeota archaeon]
MKDNSKALIFDFSKKNFYSLTPLISTIDDDENLGGLDLILADKLDVGVIKRELKKYDEIIIGTSFRTAQLPDIYERMKLIYSNLKTSDLEKINFIAGGSHPSGDPLSTLKIGFDAAFIGEAESSLSTFLDAFLQQKDLLSTPGIAYLDDKNDELKKNPRPPAIVLDEYPFISAKRGLHPPLEISRGCAFGCTFCQVPNLFQRQVRHRSPDVIINAIKWMLPRRLNDIRFITPNSFGYMSSKPRYVNEEAILYLLSSIRSMDGIRDIFFGTFPGEVRPETVTEDFMNNIKPYLSNRRISVGLQSGSDKVLKKIRRGHSVRDGLDAINILLSTGFTPVVDIIIGIPGASEEDEQLTMELMNNFIEEDVVFRAHVFMPLPGTALEKTEYSPVSSKIKKTLGRLISQGKIEGSWSQQEIYAKDTWSTIKRIYDLPPIKREDTH